MLEDRFLIIKLRRGSKDAMRRIYEKYRDDLLRVAAGLLYERSDAEDVVHDVFTEFVKGSADFKLTGSLRGYLATCVANKARNLKRDNFRKRTVAIEEAEPIASHHKRPEQWIIYDEQFWLLCYAMAQLPSEQREAVVLHLHGDMKFKDIAAVQNTSIKTALSRYRYGIDKLRSLLNSEVKNETRR